MRRIVFEISSWSPIQNSSNTLKLNQLQLQNHAFKLMHEKYQYNNVTVIGGIFCF